MSDNIIQVNQEIIHTELTDLMRTSVEEALNAMSFTTSSGEVNLKMPKLKGLTFETSI